MAAAPDAVAQSTNARPDLYRSDRALDVNKLASLPEAARVAVSAAMAEMKSGASQGFVFVASPGMNFWRLTSAPKGVTTPDRADMARTTLESCEYAYGLPCAILSIDGFDTHRDSGDWPRQPEMLSQRPSAFEAATIPFVPARVRPQTEAYLRAIGPRAFAVTMAGGWIWRTGKTPTEAIDHTMADCAATLKADDCILYAVNSRVVSGAR